jgi:hypothetical protein
MRLRVDDLPLEFGAHRYVRGLGVHGERRWGGQDRGLECEVDAWRAYRVMLVLIVIVHAIHERGAAWRESSCVEIIVIVRATSLPDSSRRMCSSSISLRCRQWVADLVGLFTLRLHQSRAFEGCLVIDVHSDVLISAN